MFGKFVLACLAFIVPHLTMAQPLPKLQIDRNRIAVAGVSSGGMMAVQLGVAHSREFSGVAVFAGGIYGCGDKNITPSGNCLTRPSLPTTHVVDYLKDLETKDLIDPISNIAKQKIYLFRGVFDKVVSLRAMKSLSSFYQLFDSDENLKVDFKQATGHVQP
jgi:poly(3-hydroxybutyrate) depolymerase